MPLWRRLEEPPSDENAWDEAETLLSLRARQPAAMERLYDNTNRRAFGLAFRILADRDAAEDVVQDAYLSIWRNAEKLDPERGRLVPLLLTIVHNRAIDKLRSGRGQAPLHPEALERQLASQLQPDAADLAMQQVDRETLQRALDTLSPEQRRAVRLAYFDGYTQVEMAALLQLPVGTVKSRLRLALQHLRRLMRETDCP